MVKIQERVLRDRKQRSNDMIKVSGRQQSWIFLERFSDSITANLERFRSLVQTFCQHFAILLFCQLISFWGEAKRAAEIQKKRNEILAQRHAAAEAFRIKNSMVRQNYTFMMVKFHFCTKNKILFFDGFDFLFSRFDRIFAWNLEVGTYHFIMYDPGRHWKQAIDEQDLLIFLRAHSVLRCEQSITNYNFTNQIKIKIYKCKINHASTISIIFRFWAGISRVQFRIICNN